VFSYKEEAQMGISTSIVLMAIGAVLAFAVDVQTEGFDLNTIGVILMVVGAIGALLSLAFWGSWGGFGARRDVVYDDRVDRVERVAPRRTVIEER
jgi:hypothetical protein